MDNLNMKEIINMEKFMELLQVIMQMERLG